MLRFRSGGPNVIHVVDTFELMGIDGGYSGNLLSLLGAVWTV